MTYLCSGNVYTHGRCKRRGRNGSWRSTSGKPVRWTYTRVTRLEEGTDDQVRSGHRGKQLPCCAIWYGGPGTARGRSHLASGWRRHGRAHPCVRLVKDGARAGRILVARASNDGTSPARQPIPAAALVGAPAHPAL